MSTPYAFPEPLPLLVKDPPHGTRTIGSNWPNLPHGFIDSSIKVDFHILQTWPNLTL